MTYSTIIMKRSNSGIGGGGGIVVEDYPDNQKTFFLYLHVLIYPWKPRRKICFQGKSETNTLVRQAEIFTFPLEIKMAIISIIYYEQYLP